MQKTSGNRLVVRSPAWTRPRRRSRSATAVLDFRVYNDQNEIVPATGVIDGKTLKMTGQYLKQNTTPLRQGTTTVVSFETTRRGSEAARADHDECVALPETDPRRLMLVYLDGKTSPARTSSR